MASPATALKRTGTTQYKAMLAGRAAPVGWSKKTLLLNFVEETGASATFVVTGDALASFEPCELWRVYDMVVPGKCVHVLAGAVKHGVKSLYEVAMRFPCKVSLSMTAWPFKYAFDFAK